MSIVVLEAGITGTPVLLTPEADWQGDLEKWQKRDLPHKRYVYFWADGRHLLQCSYGREAVPSDHLPLYF